MGEAQETDAKWAALEALIAQVATGEQDWAKVLCKCLEFLLERVNVMRIDAANARLRLIAPVIRDHGVKYERDKFKDKVKDGSLSTERVKAWLARAFASPRARAIVARLGDPADVSAYTEFYAFALAGLLGQNEPARHETMPETLLFDVVRINSLRDEFNALLSTRTAVMLIGKTFEPPHTRAITTEERVAAEARRVAAVTDGMRPIMTAVNNLGAREALDLQALGGLTDATIRSAQDSNGAIRGILAPRFLTFIRNAIVFGAPRDFDDILADMPGGGRVRMPPAFIERVTEFIATLSRLATINGQVHTETYNEIIRGFLARARGGVPSDFDAIVAFLTRRP